MPGSRHRRAVIVALLMCVACTSTPPPKPARPGDPWTSKRASRPRSSLAPEIRQHVPVRGVYVTSGSMTERTTRIVVDLDARTIYAGTAPPASLMEGTMEVERTNALAPATEQHVRQLCAEAWSEAPPAIEPDPIDGEDEVLVIADVDETFYLRGSGPIRRPAVARLVEALRAAAALP